MLELRPVCEHCATPLPPASPDAMICSFECTFCRSCVEAVLHDVCPNCGGGFCARPVRPSRDWHGGNNTASYPASKAIRHRPVDAEAHRALVAVVGRVPPRSR